jgi:hypothetical protein
MDGNRPQEVKCLRRRKTFASSEIASAMGKGREKLIESEEYNGRPAAIVFTGAASMSMRRTLTFVGDNVE